MLSCLGIAWITENGTYTPKAFLCLWASSALKLAVYKFIGQVFFGQQFVDFISIVDLRYGGRFCLNKYTCLFVPCMWDIQYQICPLTKYVELLPG